MKKVLSILLCLTMVIGIFAACSSSGSSAKYVPGKAEGSIFTSEWIGIQYTKSDDMIYATDEELEEMLDISADALYEDEKPGEQLIDYAKASSVIEMMASSIYGDNVLLMTEKLPFQNITMEQYIESFQKQMDGQGTTFDGQTSKTFAGKEFTQLDYSMDISGISLYQTYYLYKQENRMVAIIVTYFDEATREDILDGFAEYKAEK